MWDQKLTFMFWTALLVGRKLFSLLYSVEKLTVLVANSVYFFQIEDNHPSAVCSELWGDKPQLYFCLTMREIEGGANRGLMLLAVLLFLQVGALNRFLQMSYQSDQDVYHHLQINSNKKSH